MLILVNLFSYWQWLLGFGVIGLLIAAAIFFGVWPIISALLQPVAAGIGNFLRYYLEDYEEGFQVVVKSGPAILFVMTTVWAVHVVDKYYWVPTASCNEAVAAKVAQLHRQYRFLPR